MRNENWKLLWNWPHYRVMILSRVTWVLKLGRTNNLLKDENIFYWTITLWSASQGKWISILELTSNQVTSSSSKLLSNPCLWILLSSTLVAPPKLCQSTKVTWLLSRARAFFRILITFYVGSVVVWLVCTMFKGKYFKFWSLYSARKIWKRIIRESGKSWSLETWVSLKFLSNQEFLV